MQMYLQSAFPETTSFKAYALRSSHKIGLACHDLIKGSSEACTVWKSKASGAAPQVM